MKIELRWFRDQGRGQEAADALVAVQTMDGSWPLAALPCVDHPDANQRWKRLYDDYGVNAMTYSEG